MLAWWNGLTALNRGFYCAAAFFSVFFVWQLLSALFGLDDAGSDDAGAAPEGGAGSGDAAETMAAFQLLSIRSVVTFLTLFSWGGALYLTEGRGVGYAVGVSSLWGLAGMATVALILYALPKLTHTGTRNLASAVGARGQVYLDIPAGGAGEVRVEVGGVLSHVRARAADGRALKAGTPVVVTRVAAPNQVEVAPAE